MRRTGPGGYPDRPVRVIVPVAAAGGTDIIARIVLTKLAEDTGRQFVVDNRPGAGGILGNEIVAKARPDGYTLLFTYAAHTIVPFIYSSEAAVRRLQGLRAGRARGAAAAAARAELAGAREHASPS